MFGGDTPKAVLNGLIAVNKLKWEKKALKFIFQIEEFSQHGKKFSLFLDNLKNESQYR